MTTTTSIGGDCPVTLYHEDISIRDVVIEQIKSANEQDNDRHFYLCDLGDIITKYQQWVQLMPTVKPYYAVKCNDEFPVLKLLADLGASFDCASKAEIEQVLALGVSPTRFIYAHACKQTSMIKFAEQKDVNLTVFDNAAELHKIKRVHPNAMLVLRIVIEYANKGGYDLDSKFGCHSNDLLGLLQTALNLGLNVIGISFHVGSDCRKPGTYSVAIQQARYAFDLGLKLGFNMRLLDIGGGFPGDLNTNEIFQKITVALNQSLLEYFPPEESVEIIAEPGRYMVSSAGTIGANIFAKRVISSPSLTEKNKDVEKEMTVCTNQDDMVMYYINDGAYGSFSCKIIEGRQFNVQYLKSAAVSYESSVWGPSCDSADIVVESQRLPEHDIGDWLYFLNMGAYTLTLKTKFNGMEEPRRVYYCSTNAWYSVYPEENLDKKSD